MANSSSITRRTILVRKTPIPTQALKLVRLPLPKSTLPWILLTVHRQKVPNLYLLTAISRMKSTDGSCREIGLNGRLLMIKSGEILLKLKSEEVKFLFKKCRKTSTKGTSWVYTSNRNNLNVFKRSENCFHQILITINGLLFNKFSLWDTLRKISTSLLT